MPRFFDSIPDFNTENCGEVWKKIVSLFGNGRPCVKQIYNLMVYDESKKITIYVAEMCNALHYAKDGEKVIFGCLFGRDINSTACDPDKEQPYNFYVLRKVFRINEPLESSEEDTCIVCGHKLSNHIDEKDGWRCHSFGADLSQCECFLRKYRDLLGVVNIEFYSLEKRIEKMKRELLGD